MVVRLRLHEYLSSGAAYHVARVTLGAADRSAALHAHDFPEIFWVEQGRATHLVNGEPVRVGEGELVLARPEDVHVLRPGRGEPLTIVNVAFGVETLAFLRNRYFPEGDWPWEGDELPAHHRLDRGRLERLGELAARLVAGPPSLLLLERFLLEVLDHLAQPVSERLPRWLDEALGRLADDPEALAQGVRGLAALAGRSREHVNRALRSHTGRTGTATVNEIRLGRASQLLRMTDRPIARVAAESGLPNLSYFYRLFRERFGTTPRRYRVVHQVLIRGEREA